jgi:hypothetical protein
MAMAAAQRTDCDWTATEAEFSRACSPTTILALLDIADAAEGLDDSVERGCSVGKLQHDLANLKAALRGYRALCAPQTEP